MKQSLTFFIVVKNKLLFYINAKNALNIQQQEKYLNSPIELKQQLLQQMYDMDSSAKFQNVREADEDVIDLVGLLFQFIVTNNLSP